MKTPKFEYTARILSLALTVSVAADAQEPSVLDATKHPASQEYQSGYPPKILPLDTTLSWTQRFNGDEWFNENEVLEQITTPINATNGHLNKDHNQSDSDQMEMDGTGTIKQLKPDQGKIKIEHGPIDRLGMPAMTMVFRVEDTEQLVGLTKDQEVEFSVDNSSGGFVVTNIMAMEMEESNASMVSNEAVGLDANGVIKTIRLEQGKIKIEHGPIDRLGMPAMTMMFKVDDPKTLENLKKGDTVNFSVDNSAGGFVITDIEPEQ